MKTVQALAKKIGWFHVITATGCFAGYAPFAPGTVGTFVAIPLYLLLVRTNWIVYVIATVILFAIGVQGATRIEAATECKDNRIIVLDEVVGYLLTMFLLPQRWLFPILGFFVFRFFDILKPYPIRKLDQNPHLKGFGVMIDDALAAVYGNIVLQILALLLNR